MRVYQNGRSVAMASVTDSFVDVLSSVILFSAAKGNVMVKVLPCLGVLAYRKRTTMLLD